jgi:hypothetical protein
MTKFLIAFPGEAMVYPEEEFGAVVDASSSSSARTRQRAYQSPLEGSMRKWTPCLLLVMAPSRRTRTPPQRA